MLFNTPPLVQFAAVNDTVLHALPYTVPLVQLAGINVVDKQAVPAEFNVPFRQVAEAAPT